MKIETGVNVAASRERDDAAYVAGLKTYRSLMAIDHDFSDEYLIMAVLQDAFRAADAIPSPPPVYADEQPFGYIAKSYSSDTWWFDPNEHRACRMAVRNNEEVLEAYKPVFLHPPLGG